MTQPRDPDADKTTVFRPGDPNFAAPPPFAGHGSQHAQPDAHPSSAPPYYQSDAYQQPGAPYGQQPAGQYGQQPAAPYGQQPAAQYGQQPAGQYGQGSPYGQSSPATPASPWGQSPYAAGASPVGQPAANRRSFGVVGAIVAVVGIAGVIVAFTALKWFDFSGEKVDFSQLHDSTSGDTTGAAGLAVAYYQWLGWTLLAAAGVVALAATLPIPAAGPLRLVGVLVGLGGGVVTFFSAKLATDASLTDYLKHVEPGFYAAIAGFVVIAIGALIGSRRSRT